MDASPASGANAKGNRVKQLRSVASNWTAVIGCVALACGILYQSLFPAISPVNAALFLVFCYLIPVGLYELVVRKVHRNTATGLNWEAPRIGNPRRVAAKLVGLFAIIAVFMAVHAVFRIYALERLIFPLAAFVTLLPGLIPLTVLYVYQIDRRMTDPHDSYYDLGQWLLRRSKTLDWERFKPFALGWIIKGFFLPIMFAYLALNMPRLHLNAGMLGQGPVEAVHHMVTLMVVVELTIVVVGYAMTLKLFDAHIRSPNGFLGAWVVTLICYEPFNTIASGQIYPYRTGRDWHEVAGDYTLLMWPWLGLILMSFLVWVWATAIFGLRWSNLTHRGIITNGPYRYSKHPDYVAKSLFFWLTAAPFLTALTPWQAVTGTASLFVVNAVYFGRARMEEKHLSEDPDYVAYALAMNTHSIFRPVARILPFVIYTAPDGRTDTNMQPNSDLLPAE